MEKKQNIRIKLPNKTWCGMNCADGCIYWNPKDRNEEGRQYCSNFCTYYFPGERNGCFRFDDGRRL